MPIAFRADLHCHSTCSDGSATPEELIDLAVRQNLQGLAITDHDTVAAYEKAIPYAKEKGILLGTGVEFSCVHLDVSVHLLGYGFDLKNECILAFCEKHQKRRRDRNLAILGNLRRHGIVIEESELECGGTVGRPHIAKLLVDKGVVGSFQQAFQTHIGDGKCCYVRGESFTASETIDVLHKAGGKAFIAHPHLLAKSAFVKKLLELPFDGIECYYGKCPLQEEKRWVRMAQERGLLISGGSDFHGDFKKHIPLGSRWVDEETFHKIFS